MGLIEYIEIEYKELEMLMEEINKNIILLIENTIKIENYTYN